MPRPNRSKKKPPIEISDEDSTSTFSPPSPSPGPSRTGEKRGHPQSSPEKENQKPAKKTTKPTTTTDSTDDIPPYSFSPEQHLSFALDSLTQAYKGLEEEEEEEREEIKEQVEQLVYYTRSIILGGYPFTQEEEKEQEKEKANNVLKGLVEEVRALRKEVAPTKETYAERLKKDLPPSSSLPSSLSPTPHSAPSPSSRSSTSTRSKKKQLQERKLVLITDEKDQPLDTFSIRNKVNQLFVSKLQVEKPVLASIARTKGKQNILLTTTEEYNADFLIKYKEIWHNCFTFQREQKLEPWVQIIAHGVPTLPFLGEGGSKLLKEEIETFNPIRIQGLPRWISSSVKRHDPQTRFGSIVFTIESEEKRQEILKQKEISIAGTATKVVKYLEVSPTTQCTSCQKFGHIGDRCSTRACRFCAAAHLSKDHSCSTCIITGKPCKHTTPLCINCKENHFANSKDCEVLKAAKLVGSTSLEGSMEE
jgi:cell division septum initiation protein DivIVA